MQKDCAARAGNGWIYIVTYNNKKVIYCIRSPQLLNMGWVGELNKFIIVCIGRIVDPSVCSHDRGEG